MIELALKKAKYLWKKGLVHIFAGSFLTKCISFFGSIVLVRVLSKFEYGVLSYLENIYGYVWILAGLGLSNSILRFVVLKDKTEEKRNYFEYAVVKALHYNIILIAVAAVLNIFYPHRPEYRNYTWLVYILLLSLPFHYVSDNVLCHERAMFNNRRYVLFSLTVTLCIIISKISFGKLFGINGAIFSQVIVYLVLAIVFFISTTVKYYGTCRINRHIKLPNQKEVDIYSFQYMVTNGLWAVFMLNDTFLLGRFCSAEVLAEYRVAYTIPGCVSIISTSIGIFVAPYFVRNENNAQWVKINYRKTFLASAAFVGFICAAIGLLAKQVISILYGTQYEATVSIMRILLIAAFCNCGLRYTTANILAAMGHVKYNMFTSAFGVLLQISANLFMIPKYGVKGVAVTSCFVYLTMAVFLFAVFNKKYLHIK